MPRIKTAERIKQTGGEALTMTTLLAQYEAVERALQNQNLSSAERSRLNAKSYECWKSLDDRNIPLSLEATAN